MKPDAEADRVEPLRLDAYPVSVPITTRWKDADVYRHINNVEYYSWIDTALNGWLIERGLLDVGSSPIIGFIVESGCRYLRPIHFPQKVMVGIRMARVGNSSVRYEFGIFAGDDPAPAAEAYFVHVYVDAESHRPTPLPAHWRQVLGELA